MVFLLRGLPPTGGRNFLLAALTYSAVALLVLWDLLLPGYVLTLDMVFSPSVKVRDLVYGLGETPVYGGLIPLFLALKGGSFLLPVWILQKVILFLILFLSGISAFHLCPAGRLPGKLFAGLLYMLNPFVYVRFMAGHWLLLLAYAVTPFAVKSMISLFEERGLRGAVRVALLLTLVATFSSHMLLLNLLVFFAFLLAALFRWRGSLRRLLGLAALALCLFLLLNVYWILPALLFIDKSVLTAISYRDIQVFAAKTWGSGPNIFFSIASMHGFWRAGYRYISSILPGWYLLYVFILLLAVYGFLSRLSDRRIGGYVKALAAVAVVSLFLGAGAGASNPALSSFFEWLFESTVFLKGFRDTQKFVALIVLAYAYLGGLGVSDIHAGKGGKGSLKKASMLLVALALCTPFAYSLNMLGGFNGELRVVDYPAEWYQVNDFLNRQPGDFKVLFFPWHAYMTFSWSGRRLSNPAHAFFDREIIQGENIEVPGIETESRKPIQQYIHFLLKHRDEIRNFGELVAPLNIKYVVLAKEVDYRSYDFLYKQEDLKLVFEGSTLALFENKYETSKFYVVDRVRPFNGWEEILAESRSRNLMEAAYLKAGVEGLKAEEKGGETLTPRYVEKSPVEYEVEIPAGGILVFTSPYEEWWRADSTHSQANMGLTNAFHLQKTGTIKVYNEKFKAILTCYLISASTLIALGVIVSVRKFLLKLQRETA